MHLVYIVSVFLHILAATIWVGGLVFMSAVLFPLLRHPDWREKALPLIRSGGKRFRSMGWACLLTLVATGTFSLVYRGWLSAGAGFWQGSIGTVLTLKLVLAGLVLTLSAVHDFYIGPAAARIPASERQGPEALRLRRAASWMGRANLLLSVVIVLLATMLMRGVPQF